MAAPTIPAESPKLGVHMPDPSEMTEQERERRVVRGVTLTVPTHIEATVEGGSDEAVAQDLADRQLGAALRKLSRQNVSGFDFYFCQFVKWAAEGKSFQPGRVRALVERPEDGSDGFVESLIEMMTDAPCGATRLPPDTSPSISDLRAELDELAREEATRLHADTLCAQSKAERLVGGEG